MKQGCPFVESCDAPVRLTRERIPELLKTLQEDGHNPGVTWNAVDALELLVEAGHFRAARGLAEGVAELVAGSPRQRLFRGYVALCTMMEEGMVFESVQALEGVHAEITSGGHSAADRARAALLVARALFVGVSLGVLPEADLLRARAALEVALDDCEDEGTSKHRAQVGLELAKTYLYAPKPEPLPARLLLERLKKDAEHEGEWEPTARLDLERLRYHLEGGLAHQAERLVAPEELRSLAKRVGQVEEALVELSLARTGSSDDDSLERLRKAVDLFGRFQFNSGALEGLLILADDAVARGATVRGNALFNRASETAREGGNLQALLLSLLGIFHCAHSSGDVERAASARRVLEESLRSEIGIGAVGFSAIQAAQMCGDYKSAVRCAGRCERLYRQRGVQSGRAQALHLLGASHASAGAWGLASKVWGDAVSVEDLRRATVSASDKRAALAQAFAMAEHGTRGFLSEQGRQKAEALLNQAEGDLGPFERVSSARRARAKILSVRAQLCVMSKNAVAAVACLNRAREVYEELSSSRDVALTDALSGLALLEAGKSRGGELYEEAYALLHQALVFFDSPQHNVIRWKLKYYLAMAAYLSSQSKGGGRGGLTWRETSATWLRGAMDDVEQITSVSGGGFENSDFSAGLTPEVLEPLKQALGFKTKKKARGGSSVRGGLDDKMPGDGGYLH